MAYAVAQATIYDSRPHECETRLAEIIERLETLYDVADWSSRQYLEHLALNRELNRLVEC